VTAGIVASIAQDKETNHDVIFPTSINCFKFILP